MQPCVYILSSKPYGTLYVGVTSDLLRRVSEHKQKLVDGFTKEHSVDQLVYFEAHHSMEDAITREKQIKKWKRKWKIDLIVIDNPDWKDLYESII
ncbi:MAG: GIY-YIG nuclease family protein [bacterium]|nr:GIY-YIG nuclease family protein [bacterium]MDA1024409.1 GIY-YIG nuclease family protein [bacterium]